MSAGRRALWVLFSADAISMTGNAMTMIAIPWFVLQTTGSAAKTGVVAAFHVLPIVVANVFGGALIDRIGCKRMSVISDLASAATVALIPALYLTVGLHFGVLLVLVFLGALLDAPGSTARRALLPDAAQRAAWSFDRVGGVAAAVERGARLVGAPMAGVLIAGIGAVNVLWLDAGTFLVSAATVALGIPRDLHAERTEQHSYLRDLSEGFRYLRSSRLLRALIVTVAITNFLDSSIGILMPVYADDVYGSAIMLGIMTGAFGGGAVVGALAYAAVGRRLTRFSVFACAFVAVSTYFFVLASFPPPAAAIAGIAFAGFAAGPLNPIMDAVQFERVPEAMRGRVFGFIHSAAWMTIPLGVLVAGLALEALGLRATLLIYGGAYVLVTGSIWINPAMRDMDEHYAREAVASSRSDGWRRTGIEPAGGVARPPSF
jgi:MFS family permease